MALKTVRDWSFADDWPESLMTDDLALIFEALDIQFQEFVDQVEAFPDIVDPYRMPDEFLDIYLMSMGYRLATDFPGITLTVVEKRKLATLAVQVYRQKGTASGIVNIIRLLLGIETAVLTQYNVDVWKVGESLLGEDTVLFPDTTIQGSRPLYTFDIELLTAATAEQVEKIRALVEFMKPIHTHLNQIIQPPIPPDHWELDVSELGETTFLHA